MGFPRVGTNDVHLAAHLFDGRRLALARELRGLTKVELCDARRENAERVEPIRERPTARPDAATGRGFGTRPRRVPELLRAIGYPSSSISVEDCHFRSLRSATQRERRRLIARGNAVMRAARFG